MAESVGYLDFTNIQRMILGAVEQGIAQGVSKGVIRSLDSIEKALTKNPADTKNITRAANQVLAQNMRKAVLHSYDQVVTARRSAPPYREDEGKWARGKSGSLRKALEQDFNYVASSQGIHFIDLEEMDNAAKHWYRLNFGAAPRAGRQAYDFNVQLQGVSLGQVSLSSWAPSEPFRMPAGFFTEDGAFYLGKARGDLVPTAIIGRGTLTRGIAARRYLDAGMDRFSKDFNGVYGDVILQIQKKKLDGLRNLPTITV